MKNIIIELKDGTKLINDPDVGFNHCSLEGLQQHLDRNGAYYLYLDQHNSKFITESEIKATYYQTDEVPVVGGGSKYVKLQHVQELIKLYERRSNIPDWEWEKFDKVDSKIKNTVEFLKRNAKTKEEL